MLIFSWDPALPRVRQQRLFQHHLGHVSCHTYRVQDRHLQWVTATSSCGLWDLYGDQWYREISRWFSHFLLSRQSRSTLPTCWYRWRWARTAPCRCPVSRLPTLKPNGRWTGGSTEKVTLRFAAWLRTATFRLWPVRSALLCCLTTVKTRKMSVCPKCLITETWQDST